MNRPTFSETQATALAARRRAKEVRTQWKDRPSGDPKRDEAFQAMIAEFDQVVLTLKGWRDDESPYRRDAEREIGDCLGVKGGTYRDWGKYADAVFAYDEGLPYEVEAQRLGGQPNSYCLVQRLVCRVLAQPEEFVRRGSVLGVDLDVELARTAAVVSSQLDSRTDRKWAQADLALLLQLLGSKRSGGCAEATVAWDELDSLGFERHVYQSTLQTVSALASHLSPLVDLEVRKSWTDLIDRLTVV